MSGFVRIFWAGLHAFCAWRAERSIERSRWWAEQARECERRARGKLEARR